MSELPQVAYKVLTGEQMAVLEADGVFVGAPVDIEDGYIHLSAADQLDATVEKYFTGQSDLHIASVDLAVLGDAVKWEPARGGALFPHIYAPLPLDAVLAYGPMERDDAGRVKLPVAG